MTTPLSTSGYTLDDIYKDALKKLRDLHDAGSISVADFEIIMGTTRPQDVLASVNEAISNHSGADATAPERIFKVAKPMLERMERFGSALDILVTSLPQVAGFNPVGIIWGCLKFVICIARDISDSFDAVFQLLDRIQRSLPAWETYAKIFGSSDLQLLRTPLVNVYAQLMTISVQAVKFFDRSRPRTLGWSMRTSVENDFRPFISELERASKEIGISAHAEHMHQTHQAKRAQEAENFKAEEFRQELRLFVAKHQSINANSTDQTFAVAPSNHAPVDLLSPHYTGQVEELASLHRIFAEVQGNVPTRCAIYGMPGLGKTQLALQFAKISFDQSHYTYVFWTSATTIEKLNQGFVRILDLVGHSDKYHPDQNAKLTAARLWLENSAAQEDVNWLFVFDNLNSDSLVFLRENLPRKNARGNIIFTTRTEDLAKAAVTVAGTQHQILKLQIPKQHIAIELLMKSIGVEENNLNVSDLSKATEVVNSIGCLPLAIAQAASFMKQTHVTFDTLLSLYQSKHKINIIHWENNLSTYEEQSVAATFLAQLKRLHQVSADASNLLNVLSYFDPEGITVEIIIKGARHVLQSQNALVSTENNIRVTKSNLGNLLPKLKGTWKRLFRSKVYNEEIADKQVNIVNEEYSITLQLGQMATLICDTVQLFKAIQELQNLSLIEYQSHHDTHALHMHDLVQFVVQENTQKEDKSRKYFQCAVKLACAAFESIGDPTSRQTWKEYDMLVSHIQVLTKQWNIAYFNMNPQLNLACSGVATYLQHCGQYNEAETIYKSLLSKSDTQSSLPNSENLDIAQGLAIVYKLQGNYCEAEILNKQILEIQMQCFGVNHPETLKTIRSIASVYQFKGQYTEAIDLYKQILRWQNKNHGIDHIETLKTSVNLATVHNFQGNYNEAEYLYKKALTGFEEQMGVDHVGTLQVINGYANVKENQGQYTHAEALFVRALTGCQKQFGGDHPNTLGVTQGLASIYGRQGRYMEAEMLCKQVLTGRQKKMGDQHPDTLAIIHYLAIIYDKQKHHVEAEKLCKQILVEQKKNLGAHHLNTLRIMQLLAIVYHSLEQYYDAKTLLQQTLTEQEKSLGSEHPDTLVTIAKLAYAHQFLANYSEALALYIQALEGQEKKLGVEHPETLETVHDFASFYHMQKQYNEAERLYKRALEGRKKMLGDEHPDTLETSQKLTMLCWKSCMPKADRSDTYRRTYLF
ncbi:TPR-like protein [Rickenella mellea]|uniref:TPR-like protein n=1 Tax=Rickenella mellea TaxID=50990 RepID=A0A4Y7Q0S7_9AGAM|nr:TPR-like protein [Rickenella mellea]